MAGTLDPLVGRNILKVWVLPISILLAFIYITEFFCLLEISAFSYAEYDRQDYDNNNGAGMVSLGRDGAGLVIGAGLFWGRYI